MKKVIEIMIVLVVLLVASLVFTGCAELKYGKVKYTRIGDVKTKGAYVEHFTGQMTITVDPNTGLYSYVLDDANSTYTRFQFESQESAGELNIDSLAEIVATAVVKALAPD